MIASSFAKYSFITSTVQSGISVILQMLLIVGICCRVMCSLDICAGFIWITYLCNFISSSLCIIARCVLVL